MPRGFSENVGMGPCPGVLRHPVPVCRAAVVMEHCTLGQGISFSGVLPVSLGFSHECSPMEMPWDMRLVACLCAWWLFSARGSTWLLPDGDSCSCASPARGTGLKMAQGGCCWLP